jgi:hypothetical protein
MDHDDCLICSRERRAAMRSFGPTADRGPFARRSGRKEVCHDVEFRCRCGSTAQYFCQETRTDENEERPSIGFALKAENPGRRWAVPQGNLPEDINANNFSRSQRFSCKGSDTDPDAYSTDRYDRSKTCSFKLDNAIATIVEDDKTNEIAVDTWFMPWYTKHN